MTAETFGNISVFVYNYVCQQTANVEK